MELDALIAQITEEVCARIQSDNAPAPKGTSTEGLAKHIEYTLINPSIRIDEIRRMCETAKKMNLAGVCVPQWFVSTVKQLLAGSDIRVSTSVGLPGGKTVTAAKYAEVKEAVKNGADEIDIPVNMDLLMRGDFDGVKKDLEEAMTPASGRALVKAVLETGRISQTQIMDTIEVLKQCGIDYITVSSILCGCAHNVEEIGSVVRACKDSMKVKVLGHVKDRTTASAMIMAGADRIGTSAAESIA